MYELIYGQPPFRAQNHIQLQKLIEKSKVLHFSSNFVDSKGCEQVVSAECIQLLGSLLRKNPLERITFEEFFSHPFFDQSLASTPKNIPESKNFKTTDLPKALSLGFVNSPSYLKESKSRPIEASSYLMSCVSSSSSFIPPFAKLSSRMGTPPARQTNIGRRLIGVFLNFSLVSWNGPTDSSVSSREYVTFPTRNDLEKDFQASEEIIKKILEILAVEIFVEKVKRSHNAKEYSKALFYLLFLLVQFSESIGSLNAISGNKVSFHTTFLTDL